MPLDTLTPAGLLSAIAMDYLADSKLREAPLLAILSQTAESQRQEAIEWGAKVGNATTGGRLITDNLANDTPGTIVQAALSIPRYYVKHQFDVTRGDLVTALATGKITAVQNPVKTAVQDAIDSITRKIQTLLYTGTGVANTTQLGVFGLNAIAGQSGSYANISRSSYTRWKSIVTTGVTPGTPEALTAAKFSAIKLARRAAGATSRPNNGNRLLIVTNAAIEESVIRGLYSQTVNETALQEQVAKDILPYTSYYVSGIPVVSDVDSPDNLIYFINPSKLLIKTFNDSSAQVGNSRVSYIPLRVTDNNGDVVDSGINIRLADVSNEHPDIAKLELSLRFQLVATDPVDSVSVIQDVAHSL